MPTPQPDDHPTKASLGARQLVLGAATAGVLVVVFVVILPQVVDYGEAWDAVREMRPVAVVALLLVAAVVPVVFTLPYNAALPGLGLGPAFVVRQTAFMFRNAIPAGGALGFGVQYSMLRSYGINGSPATAAIGITTLADIVITLSLPAAGLVFLSLRGGADAGAWLLAGVGVVLVLAIVGVVSLVLRSDVASRRLATWAEGVASWAGGIAGREGPTDLVDRLATFRRDVLQVLRGREVPVTVTNVAVPLSHFVALWVSLVAVAGTSGTPTLVETFTALALARMLTLVPITPGGIGMVDVALLGILAVLGTDPDDALAATLIWRVVTYVPQLLLGVGTFLLWRRRSSPASTHRG